MDDKDLDRSVQEFLEVRKPDADYAEIAAEEPLFQLEVDLVNFKKFPRLDESVTYKKEGSDCRGDLASDRRRELPDYSGPFDPDLRFTDFSDEALVRMLEMSLEYYELVVGAWATEIALRKGDAVMHEIQAAAWNDGVLPQLARIVSEWRAFEPGAVPPMDAGIVTFTPFRPDARYAGCDKQRLASMLLGSHEFFLLVIESWAAQIVVRYGLDEMFDIQWAFWSDKVLPGVRAIKIKWMNVTGGDTKPVAAFMKDIQIDATSFPGKAFELTFEMPEAEVGIMSFNKCCAADQWEALGRPDILEKNCHSTCPASLIETAKMYDPNMKIDILAIPPRRDPGDVCCRWKLSMRDPSDPEYVPAAQQGGAPARS